MNNLHKIQRTKFTDFELAAISYFTSVRLSNNIVQYYNYSTQDWSDLSTLNENSVNIVKTRWRENKEPIDLDKLFLGII